MSLREFLSYEGIVDFDVIPLEDLLKNHVRYAMEITNKVKIAPLFETYLQHGYYPFYRESIEDFPGRLRDTITVVIENDLPAVEKVTFETIQKVKRLLMIISERAPFEPNMSELWKQLATNNELGLRNTSSRWAATTNPSTRLRMFPTVSLPLTTPKLDTATEFHYGCSVFCISKKRPMPKHRPNYLIFL